MTYAEEKSRAMHPAGKQRSQKVVVLQQLIRVIQQNYWVYGNSDAETTLERWDVRSMLDYAVMTCHTGVDFGEFYHRRADVMATLLKSLACEPGMEERLNYGDWRFWETESARLPMDIERVVHRALKVEMGG